MSKKSRGLWGINFLPCEGGKKEEVSEPQLQWDCNRSVTMMQTASQVDHNIQFKYFQFIHFFNKVIS